MTTNSNDNPPIFLIVEEEINMNAASPADLSRLFRDIVAAGRLPSLSSLDWSDDDNGQ